MRSATAETRGTPALYRGYVDQLTATLSNEGVVGRASEELHKIIDRVVVRHDVNRDVHELEIEGDLVELLSKAKPAGEAGYVASRSSPKLVAGARIGLDRTHARLR